MANQQEDGSWKSFDGGIHYSEHEAHMSNMKGGRTGGGAIAMLVQSAGPLIKFALIIPAIIAGIVSFLFGLLLRAGIVGRIILSTFIGMFLGIIALMITEYAPSMVKVAAIIAASVLPAIWFYYSHYFSLRALGEEKEAQKKKKKKDDKGVSLLYGAGVFAAVLTVTFGITFYGFIILLIVAFIVKSLEEIIYFLLFIPPVLSIVFYIMVMLKQQTKAKTIKAEIGSPIIGAAVAVIIAVLVPFMINAVDTAQQSEKTRMRTEMAESGIEYGKITKDTGLLTLPGGIESRRIKTIKKNQTVTLTEEIQSNGSTKFIKVTHKGDTGWINFNDFYKL